jgi:hypothetical protein
LGSKDALQLELFSNRISIEKWPQMTVTAHICIIRTQLMDRRID